MNIIPVKVCRLHPDVPTPAYKTQGAAAFDLATYGHHVLPAGRVDRTASILAILSGRMEVHYIPGEACALHTGLAFEIPPGYELQVRPRSSTSLGGNIEVALGTVDSDYRGEVGIIARTLGPRPLAIEHGTRIAQCVIAPVMVADFITVHELSKTPRGTGRFGSTGQ